MNDDYLIREIDRIGEMLVQIAHRLGLFGEQDKAIPLDTIKAEVADSELELDIDEVLGQDQPVIWLVEQKHFSDKALETFTDILMHSDTDDETKQTFLYGAVSYLDSKGYFSFLLHSYLAP